MAFTAGVILTVACVELLSGYSRMPKPGDVYAEYHDNRNDQYALTNGFPAEVVFIHKIVAVTNGIAYDSVTDCVITNTGKYPWPYDMFGPAKNWKTHTEIYTKLKPVQ